MVEQGRRKAGRHAVEVVFAVGDAAAPPLPPRSVDVVLVRHVLWARAEPARAVAAWAALLAPAGRLVLVEGEWGAGAGMPSAAVADLVSRCFAEVHLTPLQSDALWGRQVEDDRYLVVGTSARASSGP